MKISAMMRAYGFWGIVQFFIMELRYKLCGAVCPELYCIKRINNLKSQLAAALGEIEVQNVTAVQAQREAQRAMEQIKALGAAARALENMPYEVKDKIAGFFSMTDEELADQDTLVGPWRVDEKCYEVSTEYCCYGGCNLGVLSFQSQRDALLFSAVMNAIGFQYKSGGLCPECQAEYMKSCI